MGEVMFGLFILIFTVSLIAALLNKINELLHK